MAGVTRIKGFADMFPPRSEVFSFMENTARRIFAACGYEELRTPVLEPTELFRRGIGTETDVVQKEMYTFADQKGRSMTLRPEATAGVMRACIEDGRLAREGVSKLFTVGPMFRHERPQMGRMRQFHQINCECLGSDSPCADAELLLMLMRFLRELGISAVTLELNSLGCPACRPGYHQALKTFLAGLDRAGLCADCVRRMETNPLRVLDCKADGCRALLAEAPVLESSLCGACREHFAAVRRILEKADVPYRVNPRLVRGLDYYMRTTFEVISTAIGSQGAIAGGGRYDGLVQALGGPDVPGVGFACGMERLEMLLSAPTPSRPDFYVAVLESQGLEDGVLIAHTLRGLNLRGETAFTAKSAKSQLRHAQKTGARTCIILGGEELQNGTLILKDMDSGAQRAIRRDELKGAFS